MRNEGFAGRRQLRGIMLPNTWNQPRFRQENDQNAHHFYTQDMHSNPAAMQMNVVLQQDAHNSMTGAHSGMNHAHTHLGNTHQSLQPHFHMLRGPDQPQYKQPPEMPVEAKVSPGKAPIMPTEEATLVKKKTSNNGVLVKVCSLLYTFAYTQFLAC